MFDADGIFVVPPGVRLVRFRAWGAAGGGAPNGSYGGPGGFAEACMTVTPGEALTIKVGTGGKAYPNWQGGAPGGGNGGQGGNASGTGGGGFSGVFRGTVSQANALLIAAGGGGAGSIGADRHGGTGGGLEGGNGYSGSAGNGGTQTAPGSGYGGGQGALQGGTGMVQSSNYSGGGGGGGWYGGGGGGAGTSGGAAAGGGSGYIAPGGRCRRLPSIHPYNAAYAQGMPPSLDGWSAGIGQGAVAADGGSGRVIIEW